MPLQKFSKHVQKSYFFSMDCFLVIASDVVLIPFCKTADIICFICSVSYNRCERKGECSIRVPIIKVDWKIFLKADIECY